MVRYWVNGPAEWNFVDTVKVVLALGRVIYVSVNSFHC